MTNLIDYNESDLPSIRGFVPFFDDKNVIKELKLIWNCEKERNSNCWEGLAIKFVDGLSPEVFLKHVLHLHADEYEGTQDAYHLFLFN
jgi:hypothetical protein